MFELRVLNGLHQGAALPLVGEQWLIGTDAGNDLALYDPGIAALHCRLSRNGDDWNLDAEGGLFNDDEGHALTATALIPNQTFALGNVWLCLAPAAEEWPQVPMRVMPETLHASPEYESPALNARSAYFKLTCGVLAGMVVGATGAHWGLDRSASEVVSKNAPLARARQPQLPSSTDKILLTDREDIRRHLHTLLTDRLLTQVSIEDRAEGLSLNGNLQGDTLAMYRRMLSGFNARYALSIPVLDNVSIQDSGLPFVIAQVISGTNAHLVTADGHRMYVGDQFNGVRLTRIDNQRLEFDGHQHLEVQW